MSAQFKLEQPSSPNQSEKTADDQKRNIRPNIDHLLKRINAEKKKERRSSFIVLVLAISVVSVVSYLFNKI